MPYALITNQVPLWLLLNEIQSGKLPSRRRQSALKATYVFVSINTRYSNISEIQMVMIILFMVQINPKHSTQQYKVFTTV